MADRRSSTLGAALLIALSLALSACGTQGRESTAAAHPSLAASTKATTFDGRVVYEAAPTRARSYPAGVRAVRQPLSPAGYEEAELDLEGGGQLTYSLGGRHLVPNAPWAQTIRIRPGRPFLVNGRRYSLPSADRKLAILVLPLARGIVWAALDPAPLSQPVLQSGSGFVPNPASLKGSTPIFYTPYGKGGSLVQGAQVIARVPWRWQALNGPVAATAWAGWLPAASIRPASSAQVQAHLLRYARTPAPNPKMVSNVIERQSLPGFPTLFLQQVGPVQPDKVPCVAYPMQFDRTQGGFVLEVRLIDPNYGMAGGMGEAAYYWSEARGMWTPLTQLAGYQTLDGFIDVGRNAVYWQQPVPEGNGDGTELGLVQQQFDPATGEISPVFTGDFIYGESFVDGAAWVHATPISAKAWRWTEYSPPGT